LVEVVVVEATGTVVTVDKVEVLVIVARCCSKINSRIRKGRRRRKKRGRGRKRGRWA
jgi:hypothetical protein